MWRRGGRVLLLMLLVGLLLPLVSAETDPHDIKALQVLYGALNCPPQLRGWTSEGGDPCGGEPWEGVSCTGQSVTSIKIKGLALDGYLGFELSSFKSLIELDVSFNSIGGEIPLSLPPKATRLNLACNQFVKSIPLSLPYLKSLAYLNLSHNSLSGPIGNVFTNLQNLEQMDLSFNEFTGDLPTSFSSLTNLYELYLQTNRFTGSVNFLADLPLSILNLDSNRFSGAVPKQFDSIHQLKIEGNMFQPGDASPPSYINGYSHPPSSWTPVVNVTPDWNVSHNPVSTTNSFGHSSQKAGKHDQQMFSPGATAGTICGVLFVALLVTAIFIIHNRRPHKSKLDKSKRKHHPAYALPVTAPEVPRANRDQRILGFPSMKAPRPPSIHHTKPDVVSRRKSCSRKVRSLSTVKHYSACDLLIATNSFHEKNLLGEGLFGSVYRAEFPDNKICVIKKLEVVTLSMHEEDEFIDFVWSMSHVKHPSIVRLLGYSMEQGQHMLVYEYIRNGSLHDLLHSSNRTQKILSWGARVKIALGVAHALEYLHWTCCPPIAHENLKSTNILLDDQLMPHLSDCGLTKLWPLMNIKSEASTLDIGNTNYDAPEFGIAGTDKTMNDVYSFGVLLLELLMGRKPFDREKEEQSLAMQTSSCLHDLMMLESLTDPAIKGTISSNVLSQFADIISLCIQAQPQFRAPITEVADMLGYLIQCMSHHRDKQVPAEKARGGT